MRVGTRGSKLAMAQAEKVCRLLKEAGVDAEPATIKTSGDIQVDRPLHAIKGGFGAFVREIDDHLIKGDIDLAVHSLKDVPTKRPEGLVLAAVLPRESALDVVITRDGRKLSELGEGSIVGTSSTRRSAQIKRHYPHLLTKNIRGNVDTRLRKLNEGEYDAIMLAEAGLIRLDMSIPVERLDPYTFVPSANQGVIAIVTKKDTDAFFAARKLNHMETWIETQVERIIISRLEGGCVVPMGAYACMVGDELDVICEVLSLDGSQQVRVRDTIPVEGYEEHAARIAERLSLAGGKALVDAAKKELRGVTDEQCN
ncbi:hydroxymethylbilane synthase [Methanocella sp. CWC-04]|uniref:Probable porphobilinogen deaminase n=1 Tax=Methanooceanicella nereidis TaxID=2052831 RepID=A0AAP2RFA6_9EURY|nr:hydroxymethylbilane synthase [Methanocella sp. CWC-04]MCD1296258.1 hydroxymethylbilane synthase [Methanocella sp. CWC-04]